MRIDKLKIQHFRSVRSLELDLDDTTVFIGPNNAGKSAILDSVRIALSHRWGQRGTGFTENDIHSPTAEGDPRTLPPVEIEMIMEEPTKGSWPDDMVSDLDKIMSMSSRGKNLICLRINFAWNPETELFEPGWDFLDASGIAKTGKAKNATNLSGFFNYLPLFWLGALRDANSEFTPRSQHWGRLLRSVKIPKELETEVKTALDSLNDRLLIADPRLGEIADTIGQATHVAVGESPGAARMRMLPLNIWDMLSRAGIVMRNEDLRPWLPLDHHGQGLQSLSVIFLFHAAVTQQLKEDALLGMEPIFAIEEPEAHLHPQAARTLWERVSALPGQKLVTTHSPYFVQHVPIHNLRIVRLKNGHTEVFRMPRRLCSNLPWTQEVANLAAGTAPMLEIDPDTNCVASTSWFDEAVSDKLARCWRGDPTFTAKEAEIERFRHECRILMSKDDELVIAFQGRLFRGEIFFARRWILVEGVCEYLLLHALGRALEYPLDQHGVSVIDFQNNSPTAGIYPTLADAFGIPWDMVTDGDSAGLGFRQQITKRGFNEADLKTRFSTLTPPRTLEDQLIEDGHEQLLRKILAEIGPDSVLTCPIDEFRARLNNVKARYMTILAMKVATDPVLARKMPKLFIDIILGLKNGTL